MTDIYLHFMCAHGLGFHLEHGFECGVGITEIAVVVALEKLTFVDGDKELRPARPNPVIPLRFHTTP